MIYYIRFLIKMQLIALYITSHHENPHLSNREYVNRGIMYGASVCIRSGMTAKQVSHDKTN